MFAFFFQAEDGIRDTSVTGVQTCALPIFTANVAPRLMHEMCSAALTGDLKKARELNFKLLGLHIKLFVEANPIPVKWAVAQKIGRASCRERGYVWAVERVSEKKPTLC